MAHSWEVQLQKWSKAGLLDEAAVSRIRAYEKERESAGGLRWPTLIAIGLGALMLGAGVLLFVAAHWDGMSPAARFTLLLAMVAAFHVSGAVAAGRFAALSTGLHAVGTASLGAAIFLSGQIFHLEEHWPGGVMLWALGAAVGWALLRDVAQGTLLALLGPAWLASEWIKATERMQGGERVMLEGLLLLAVTYLSALTATRQSAARKALAWIGGLTLIPLAAMAMPSAFGGWGHEVPTKWIAWARVAGLVVPTVLALVFRGRAAWMNVVAAAWVGVLASIPYTRYAESGLMFIYASLGPYIWSGLACLAMIAWGLAERRSERINLGVAGFGITVLTFYFSQVMDKLGRSTSLMGLGLLFLLLGWTLERTRRQLVARMKGAAA